MTTKKQRLELIQEAYDKALELGILDEPLDPDEAMAAGVVTAEIEERDGQPALVETIKDGSERVNGVPPQDAPEPPDALEPGPEWSAIEESCDRGYGVETTECRTHRSFFPMRMTLCVAKQEWVSAHDD